MNESDKNIMTKNELELLKELVSKIDPDNDIFKVSRIIMESDEELMEKKKKLEKER